MGAKTAARVVLELKDKIAKDITSASSSADGGADYGVVTADEGDKLSEAVNALLVLGYTKAEALSVTRALDIPSMSLEDIIREALKKLMKA